MDEELPGSDGHEAEPATVTERMERAVLDLLADQGVLAGININDVARKAQVTRGLVSRHFGDRRVRDELPTLFGPDRTPESSG